MNIKAYKNKITIQYDRWVVKQPSLTSEKIETLGSNGCYDIMTTYNKGKYHLFSLSFGSGVVMEHVPFATLGSEPAKHINLDVSGSVDDEILLLLGKHLTQYKIKINVGEYPERIKFFDVTAIECTKLSHQDISHLSNYSVKLKYQGKLIKQSMTFGESGLNNSIRNKSSYL